MKSDPQTGQLVLAKDAKQLEAAIARADLAVIFTILLTKYDRAQLSTALLEAAKR